MSLAGQFRSLNSVQRNTFAACFLGWTLDAFDFFLLTFCLTTIAACFHASRKQVEEAIFWTLAMRPVGAFLFGMMAERLGRRPTLIVNVVAFSVFELASAFAPTLHSFLVCRALFGIAMGGVWGVGAALALESLPARESRLLLGTVAGGLRLRQPACRPAFRDALPSPARHRPVRQLARPVYDWGAARSAWLLPQLQGRRVACMARGSPRPRLIRHRAGAPPRFHSAFYSVIFRSFSSSSC